VTVIKIDPEFHSYIPPLSTEEYQQLEANLVQDGCRDPLIVWGEILIDGHNRYEICTRLGLPFRVAQKFFFDREEALDWMDAHQLGRRNLTPDARKLLLGRRYNRLKMTRAEAGAIGGGASKDQNDTCLETPENRAVKLAKEHGVSEATVKRAGKFAEEVDRDDELKAAVASGKSVAAVKRERVAQEPEAPKPEPIDPERRKVARMNTEAMVDEIIGLRADLKDAKAKAATLQAERDVLKAELNEATATDQGAVISSLQKQLRAAKHARDEAMSAAKRMEHRLKKVEARVKELEEMPVGMDAAA
jgi:hypothetical protein